MQNTLKDIVEIQGTGAPFWCHSDFSILPASPDYGIVFKRVDVAKGDNLIPAKWDKVVDTRLCTVIANENGVSVGTIEHLMAAFRGCGIDNAL